MRSRKYVFALCAVGLLCSSRNLQANTIVSFDFTNFGTVQVELFDSEAPVTVANFLAYVTAGRYDDSMIHRVDTGLGVVQGGGFTKTAAAIPTNAAIPLEYSHPNARGTLGMARLADNGHVTQTATAMDQWFFNTVDNTTRLGPAPADPAHSIPQTFGYAVFGQVLGNGMDVIDAIAAVQVFPYAAPFNQVPLQNFSMADKNNNVDPLPHVVVLHSVTVVAAVPEPPSLVLAALAVIGLAAWSWRNCRR